MSKLIEQINIQIQETQNTLQEQIKIKSLVESLDHEQLPFGSIYGDTLDFDNLSHVEIVALMKVFAAGRWTKTPSDYDARIHYETKLNGIKIRCWSGEPPPNCKIVEEIISVPAQPATTRLRKRLVCTEKVDV